MKRLSEFIVSVADLFEAEGRAALHILRAEGRWIRSYIARLGVGLACLAVSFVVVIVGVVLLGRGAFLWMEQSMGTPAASSITGLAFLIFGSLLVWIYHSNAKA